MQHIGTGMWCNLISASTGMPSHIQRHKGARGRNDMNVQKGNSCPVALGNQTALPSTIVLGPVGSVDDCFSILQKNKKNVSFGFVGRSSSWVNVEQG